MTIRKFAEWGQMIARPLVIETCDSDSKIAQMAIHFLSTGTVIPHIHATGGGLARSLGDANALDNAEVHELSVDLMTINYHTKSGSYQSIAANSVLLRHRWWAGPIIAVTNSGYLGMWEIAMRAHSNDGRFDVVEIDGSMSIRDRLGARRRLTSGSQLTHPSVKEYQVKSREWNFDRPIGLYSDQVFIGRVTFVRVSIMSDALKLVI